MRFYWVAAFTLMLGCGPKEAPPPAAGSGGSSTGFVNLDFEEDDDDMDIDMIRASAVCQNLRQLEPAAMMGRLSDAQIRCLEDALRDEDRQTQMKKISLVLMADAWSKGDKERWGGVVSRHLDKIDRSDPELCYRYSSYLSDKGPKKSEMTIKWAEVALENRAVWVGDTYVVRVNALYKLKARAALNYWNYLEEKMVTDQSVEMEESVEAARNRAKVLSREWLEYARTAGKDATLALQLCEQVSGSTDYCSGE